jgi:hypothetical protein
MELRNMPQESQNPQTQQNPNRPQTNQTSQPQQPMSEEKIKEVIMDTLIELNLVPVAQKRKAIASA